MSKTKYIGKSRGDLQLTFRHGDRVLIDHSPYLLVVTGPREVMFVSFAFGRRYTNPIRAGNAEAVTLAEVAEMVGEADFDSDPKRVDKAFREVLDFIGTVG